MQAKRIFDGLTGGIVTDKAYLVDMITKYGRKEKDKEEVKKLGEKLYQILLDNGLNEKPEMDKDRLLDKADNYIYGDRFKDAIEVLKVLESQEDWALYKDKYPLYYFNNEIEVKKFTYLTPNLDFMWKPSIKNEILTLLAYAEIELGKAKEAKQTLEFFRKINPVSINLIMLEAKFEKERNLERFKAKLFEAFKYAYTKEQFANIYKELSYYYEQKSEYEICYCLLRAGTSFSNSLEIEKAEKRLHAKFKELGIKLPTDMTGEDVGNKLLSLNIPIKITEDMFTALSEGYVSYLESGYASLEGKNYYRELIFSVTGDDSYVFDLEDMANVPKEEGEERKEEKEERVVLSKAKQNKKQAKTSTTKTSDTTSTGKSLSKKTSTAKKPTSSTKTTKKGDKK